MYFSKNSMQMSPPKLTTKNKYSELRGDGPTNKSGQVHDLTLSRPVSGD